VIPDPSPSAAASKIGHIGYSYYERLRSDPIPPPGSLFRGLLVCPQLDVPPCSVGLSALRAARTVSGCRRLSFRMASANFEDAGSSRVIQSE
jgi:hypothetical protein